MSTDTRAYNNNQNGIMVGNVNQTKSDGFTDNGTIG